MILSLVALGTFVVVRNLPVGSDLNHMDFRVAGPNVIPFCDPAAPAFIPVVAVRSPVELRARTAQAAVAGFAQSLAVQLTTAGGKTIGERDLTESHTRKLHLLVVDPTLRDYQHLHPEFRTAEGAWVAEFTPRRSGAYRIFADFVPAATGRGLYAFADLDVRPAAPGSTSDSTASASGSGLQADHAGYRFSFSVEPAIVRARQRAELALTISPTATGENTVVPLEPVMGAFAHVVAFDLERSGFAHLHPAAVDPLAPPEARRPRFAFTIEIPNPGDYVLWAQVKLAGVEQFVPFRLTVQP